MSLIEPFPVDELNKLVDESPRFRKAVTAVGPAVIGMTASALSGSTTIGEAAKIAATGTAAASTDTFIKVVTHVGFAAGLVALTVAATPLFVVGFPVLAIASMFEKEKLPEG